MTNFARVAIWLASHNFDVVRAAGNTVHVVRGDGWADDFQRLHKIIPDELHLLTCGGNEKPMVKVVIGDTLALVGLTDQALYEAHERWQRLQSERLAPGTRILANGFPGEVKRDDRHELFDSARIVWVKLDVQKTDWPLGFYPENVALAEAAGEMER